MTQRLCLVHYHEIGLKGKNRSTFENQLVTNLHRALRGFDVASIGRISGYVVVEAKDHRATDAMAEAIRRVPGVARVSLAYKCGLDEEEYKAAAVQALSEAGNFSTFKVHARRSSTTYPVHTLEMNQLVGSALCEAFPDKKAALQLLRLSRRHVDGRQARGHVHTRALLGSPPDLRHERVALPGHCRRAGPLRGRRAPVRGALR